MIHLTLYPESVYPSLKVRSGRPDAPDAQIALQPPNLQVIATGGIMDQEILTDRRHLKGIIQLYTKP
jgi:hypothetical protein